jgi:hypothetical protein
MFVSPFHATTACRDGTVHHCEREKGHSTRGQEGRGGGSEAEEGAGRRRVYRGAVEEGSGGSEGQAENEEIDPKKKHSAEKTG